MFSRRTFLRTSLQTSALVALAPTVPTFLAHTARATAPQRDGRVLVIVQLDGGNDGINTVVPFKDEGYAKHRKELRLPTDRLLKITKEVGLHPAMDAAAQLWERGQLAIVQGVSYPNPSRSHFHSMRIWQSANTDLLRFKEGAADAAVYGWVGQALDRGRDPADGAPAAVYVGIGTPPVALRSRRCSTSAMTRPEDSILTLPREARPDAAALESSADLAAFVRRSTLDAYATSARMAEVLRVKDTEASYPATALSKRLRVIARLIKGGVGTRVFYLVHGNDIADTGNGSYDTHSLQLPFHADLLGELSGALRAFLDDLAAAKLAERVVILCFSEFGRRVAENGSRGTDHGTAGPVLLVGPRVKSGLVGEAPKLLDLQDGDLKMTTDFRRVYATVLEDWLGLPSKSALGATFDTLPLFRG